MGDPHHLWFGEEMADPMKVPRPLAVLVLLFAFVSVAPGFSQDDADHYLMLFYRTLGDSPDRRAGYLLYEVLLANLSEIAPELHIVESPAGPVIGSDDPTMPDSAELTGIARKGGAQAWLAVQVTGELSELEVTYLYYDIERRAAVTDAVLESADATRAVERLFWNEVVTSVAKSYREMASGQQEGVEGGRNYLLIRGLPDTRLEGLGGEEPLVIGDEGWVRLQLYQPATYTVRATLPGYFPVEKSFYLGLDVVELDLDQRRGIKWGLSFHLQNIAYPGVEALYYLLRNTVFVRIGITNLFLFNPISYADQYPMSILDFSLGAYLSHANRKIRFYTTLGFFNRIKHISPKEFFRQDEVSSLGLSYSLGVDAPVGKRFRYFMELRPRIYIINNVGLFDAVYPDIRYDESDFLLWEPGRRGYLQSKAWPWWVWDFGRINLGFQWQFD